MPVVTPRQLQSQWSALPSAVRGPLWMVLATLLFTAMHAMIRVLSADVHPFQIAFFRNAFGLLLFAPWFFRSGPRILHTQQFRRHLLRAVIMSTNMLAAFTALSLISLAQVAALLMATPLAVTFAGIVFLGEHARLRRWSALIIGLLGALIIIRPGFQEISFGMWLTLAVVCLGSSGRVLAKSMTRHDPPVTITAYMNLLMTPMTLLPALWVWGSLDWHHIAMLIVLGVTGSLAQLAVVNAYQAADLGAVEPVTFLRLIWAALIGYWLFGEFPDLWTWIGGTIICASATYIAIRENKLRRLEKPPP